jgi:hypothetical protein
MDGRCQEKTVAFAKKLFVADYIDNITQPGMDKILAGGPHVVAPDEFLPTLRDWVRRKADISAHGHGSAQVLITAHCGCAGNPVPYEEHLEHLRAAKESVAAWGLFQEVRTAVFDDSWNLAEVTPYTRDRHKKHPRQNWLG